MRMESKQTKIISKGKPASQIKPVRKDSKKAVILTRDPQGRHDRGHHEADWLGKVRCIVGHRNGTLDEGVYTVTLPQRLKNPLIKHPS
jgi:hypothetical protein